MASQAALTPASADRPSYAAHWVPRWAPAAAIVLLAALWPAYAFTGQQSFYVASCVASGAVAAQLVWQRSRLVLVYLAFVVGLIGTEVSGVLGAGNPPLGTLRFLDATIAIAMLGCGVAVLRQHGSKTILRGVQAAARRPLTLVKRAPGVTGCALLLVYCTVLWALNGAVVDGLLRTDVRLVVLAAASWLLVRFCDRGDPLRLMLAFCALGPLCLAKALAIRVSGLWTIGPFDRLQTSIVDGPEVRVILLGGDTLMIVVPAVAALGASLATSRRARTVFLACAAAAAGGLILSGTRTSILVAGGLAAAVTAIRATGFDRRSAMRSMVAVGVALALLLVALVATGVGTRFVTPDPEHVGINFRKDELGVIFDLPRNDLLLGQGLGGRFVGKDINGAPDVTGWSHALPAWILLKGGIPGMLFSLGLLAWGVKLAIVALRMGQSPHEAAFGATVVVGLLVLSLTLNRAALPEGAVLLAVSVGLIAHNVPRRARD